VMTIIRPDVFFIHKDKRTELPMLTDQMGFICAKEQVESVLKGFLEFCNYYGDKEISRYNQELHEEHMSPNRPRENDKPPKPPKKGYVYLIKAENGLTKIGETISPKKRYSSIKTAVPMDTEFLFAVKTNNAPGLEEKLHEKFSNKREMGEWFRLSEKDIDNTKQHFTSLGYEIVGSEVVG
jgi:hypothetical protein